MNWIETRRWYLVLLCLRERREKKVDMYVARLGRMLCFLQSYKICTLVCLLDEVRNLFLIVVWCAFLTESGVLRYFLPLLIIETPNFLTTISFLSLINHKIKPSLHGGVITYVFFSLGP